MCGGFGRRAAWLLKEASRWDSSCGGVKESQRTCNPWKRARFAVAEDS